MEDISKLKDTDRSTYTEGVEFLNAEAAEDERARMKYGTDRWARPTSQDVAVKLYAQIGEIDGYLMSANSSDELVKSKLKDWDSVLRVLSGSDRDLEEFVPSSRRATITPRMEKEAGRLRACLNEVSHLENRRRRKIEALREKAKLDDISKWISLLKMFVMADTSYRPKYLGRGREARARISHAQDRASSIRGPLREAARTLRP